MKTKQYAIWILIFAASITAPGVPDPCESYNAIDGSQTSQQNNTDPYTPLCDKDLVPGWYRFTGAEVATSNVDNERCSNGSTIWMNDTVPPVGYVVSRKFCFDHLGLSPTKCLWSEQVPVKNCGGFRVYQFPLRTILCPMTICTESFPKITTSPTLSEPKQTSDGEFRQRCTVSSSNTSPDARFNVTWSMDGVPVSYEILSGKERDSHFNLSQWRGHINKQLTCSVQSYYALSSATTSPEYTSNPYFGGIKVEPQPVRTAEGDETVMEVVSTLPIQCLGRVRPYLCQLELFISSPELQIVGDCKVSLTPSDWNSSANESRTAFVVSPRQDLVVKPDQQRFLSIHVSPNENSGNLEIWESAALPRVQILTEDTMFVSCFGHGDPHFTESFNSGVRGSYNLYHLGDFRFASDARVPIAVQISTNVFSPEDLPVISAVAVQTGSDVTIIDTLRGSTAPIVTSNTRPTSHTVQFCGTNEYQISAPTGHRINVYHRYQVPGGHYIDVRAMFPSGIIPLGEVNVSLDNVTDDSQSLHEVCYIEPVTEGQTTLGSFGEISANVINHFRVRPENSLFRGNTLNMTSPPPRIYCSCQSDGKSETKQCTEGPEVDDPYVRRPTCRLLQTRVSNGPVNQTNQTENDYSGEQRLIPRSWPTPSGITEDEAVARCLDAIRNFTSPQCSALNINISNFIDGCAADVQASGGFGYIPAATQAFQSSCETAILNNATTFNNTSEDDFGIVRLVTSQCPNLCSLHGVCVRGQCRCDPGWEWEDCSVNSGSTFRILRVRGGNLCDMSVFDDCFNPHLIVENLGVSTLCRIEAVDYNQGQPGAPKETFKVDGFRENRFSVSCNITTLITEKGIHARAFNLSLVTSESDIRDDTQNISYLVYDGVCQKCDEDFTCYQKQDACLIGGRCYRAGEINAVTDYMQVCDPSSDLDGWTDLLNTFPITVGRK